MPTAKLLKCELWIMVCSLVVLLTPGVALCATATWIGSDGGGDNTTLTDPGNWLNGVMPGATDEVILSGPPATIVAAGESYGLLSAWSGGAYTIQGELSFMTDGITMRVGDFTGAGNTADLTVSGPSSVLSSVGQIRVYTGSSLEVNSGARITTPDYLTVSTASLRVNGPGTVLEAFGIYSASTNGGIETEFSGGSSTVVDLRFGFGGNGNTADGYGLWITDAGTNLQLGELFAWSTGSEALIENRAAVNVTGDARLGVSYDATTEFMQIDLKTFASLTVAGQSLIGDRGNALMHIDSGATFNPIGTAHVGGAQSTSHPLLKGSGEVYVSGNFNATGNVNVGTWGDGSVTLTGLGQFNADTLTIGLRGTFDMQDSGVDLEVQTLEVLPGGTLTMTAGEVWVNQMIGLGNNISFPSNLYLGHNDGVGNHTVGAGQTLTVHRGLSLGEDGTSTGTLTIEQGGSVIADYTALGILDNASGYVVVRDPGSTLASLDNLSVGTNRDTYGNLRVESGGYVTAPDLYIARYGGDGDVLVTGAGSLLEVTGEFETSGGQATLRVEAGGRMTIAGRSLTSDGSSDSVSQITVTGNGSRLDTTGVFYVGGRGVGSLHVLDQASFSCGLLVVDTNEDYFDPPSTPISQMVVDASQVSLLGSLTVGNYGQLSIRNAGQVDATSLTARGPVIVDGAGTVLRLSSDVYFSQLTVEGSTDQPMQITGGAEVSAEGLQVAGYDQGALLISGPGSQLQITNPSQSWISGFGDGWIHVEAGAGLSIADRLVVGGSNVYRGQLLVTGPGSTAEIGANLYVSGSENFSTGALVDVTGPGDVVVEDGAALDVGGRLLLFSESTLRMSAGGHLTTVDYEQRAGAELLVSLDSMASPVITATGVAELSGLLDIELAPGVEVIPGDQFELLSSTSLVGRFTQINGLQLNDGLMLGIDYGLSAVTLHVMLAGDLTHDGFVGLDDLDILLANWNQNVTAGEHITGDLNGDGYVGLQDLDTLLLHWNQGTSPATTIPEPFTLCFMLFGSFTLLHRRP